MTVMKCYGHGLKAAAVRPKVALFLWLFNLALAGWAGLVLAPPLAAHFGESLALDKLMASFDANALLEFLAARGEAAVGVFQAILLAMGAYVLAWPFFQGGLLSSLATARRRGDKAGAVFFGGGGRFYGRFLRLQAFSLVLWVPAAAALAVFNRLLGLAASDPKAESLRFIVVLASLGAALLVFNFVRMILDYARIEIVLSDSRRVFTALLRAARFVFGHPGRAFILFYLFALTALPFLLGYAALRLSFPQTAPGAVGAVFGLGQVFIFVRGLVRVAFQAGQMAFFRSFEAAQDAGGKGDQGLEKVENGVDRDPQQTEGKEQQPDEGIEDKAQQGEGPAEKEQDEP